MSVIAHPEHLLSELERGDRPLTARTLLPTAMRRANTAARLKRIEQRRAVDAERVRSIVLLGMNAMHAQLALSLVEAEVVERSPHAIHGVALIKDRMNQALVDHLDVSVVEAIR